VVAAVILWEAVVAPVVIYTTLLSQLYQIKLMLLLLALAEVEHQIEVYLECKVEILLVLVLLLSAEVEVVAGQLVQQQVAQVVAAVPVPAQLQELGQLDHLDKVMMVAQLPRALVEPVVVAQAE
jgi:hypothetical protein